MSTELYLDTARLGRMCRGARTAEQEFGWLVGQLGSSLYLERFLSHGFRSLPSRFRRRVPDLKCWPGVAGFRQALGRFVRQPTGLPTHFFGQSSALIRFAAQCLFDKSHRVMVTDLAWPAYVRVLQQVATEKDRELCLIPLRHIVMSDRANKADVVRHLSQAYQRYQCDGLFLSDITYLGIKLPVKELLAELMPSNPRFVVIDGAQAFHQRTVDLSSLNCDLYLAGTQKWFGAYHPLRLAFIGRGTNSATIEEIRRKWSGDHPDALFDFCHAVQHAEFASFGETVNVSPLIVAAGALQQARRQANSLHDPWEVLLTNARSLADWIGDPFCRPVRRHDSLASGILLLSAKRPGGESETRARSALARSGIIASAFPNGLLRLSMPRYYLPLRQRTLISRALHRSFHSPAVEKPHDVGHLRERSFSSHSNGDLCRRTC